MICKIYIFSLIIALGFTPASAQDREEDKARSEVEYSVAYVCDTVTGKILTDTFCLRYNDEKSLFYNKYQYEMDSLRVNDVWAWAEKAKNLLKDSPKHIIHQTYYVLVEPTYRRYTYRDNVSGNTFQFTDSIPEFTWHLTDEEKTIAGHICKKASCSYAGRRYEAWYALDIPVGLGPWKLCGLPGLILEAYDTDRLYTFVFIGRHPSSGNIGLLPMRHFKSTKAIYDQNLKDYLHDPLEYMATKDRSKATFKDEKIPFVQELKMKCRHQPIEIF